MLFLRQGRCSNLDLKFCGHDVGGPLRQCQCDQRMLLIAEHRCAQFKQFKLTYGICLDNQADLINHIKLVKSYLINFCQHKMLLKRNCQNWVFSTATCVRKIMRKEREHFLITKQSTTHTHAN